MIYYRNGQLHEGGIRQDIGSPAFRFGAGVFETLLYNGRNLCRLPAHLARARRSLEFFGLTEPEASYGDARYAEAIAAVLRANGLTERAARVNIFFPAEDESGTVVPVIAAVPYAPQPDKTYRLALASVAVQHPYFAHKSMNAMFHWMERRSAQALGYDDAVLVHQDGVLLETTTAALVFGDGTSLCTPGSADRLESTALAAAREVTPIDGCTVRASTAGGFRHAYVLNSLMGMRPVVWLNGVEYAPDEATCARLTEVICS
ncbi:aminotransferase class IV [Desulfovibrio psychrotolerans]|uniref:4-amino-4-deoxychorismate lyase n=1 Tax=Desulfovibrio psychrotolerans TaxID=415242 RepID=A0A7J0BZ92_9BACT|nr:aminotransferase class IV [Desulfovibrio psychrotolerans]GFM38482.1 hypothetical protein DSM19430T_31660 [Desulfovibrio psychrotolerans]